MTDFITTGFYEPTLTTVDDPELKVFEVDNGISWTIKFYVGTTLIDVIDLEHLVGDKANKDVLNLPVYDGYDDTRIGTLKERLQYALEVHC
jgi:hypothetical protein